MNTQNRSLTIAVLQEAGGEADVDANLTRIRAAAERAKASSAQLLITPEMFLTGYNIGERLAPLVTEDLEQRIAALAGELGIGLAVGTGIPAADGISNGVIVADERGTVIARYRKTHLFGDLDRALFTAGTELGPVFDFHGVSLGILICYDVEFPETVRALALAGAELLVVPTAQMEPFEFVPDHLIRVRAWENQIAIAYANRVGREGDLRYVGRSSVVGADGTPLAEAGPTDPALLIATVSGDAVLAGRAANPYLRDRIPDLPVVDAKKNGSHR